MPYVLYGSQTSPFVRRLRLLLHGIGYEFKEMNVFDAKDAALLNKINPLNQIPVLQHEEKIIWDSRQIFEYLNDIHQFEALNWQDGNLLKGVEGAMDSAIALFMMKRSGMNIDENYMYTHRQKDRINSVLDYFRPYFQDQGLKEWKFLTMTLYSFLEWGTFRNMVNLEGRPECKKFLETHSQRPAVLETAIPKA
jgi:glutathione S-transferase